MSELLRVYEPDELGRDGYPLAWHRGAPAIKDLIRGLADNRCVRCGHPYANGSGEWSRCDATCRHGGPARYYDDDGRPTVEAMPDAEALAMLVVTRPVEARWRILTVHHLTGDKADCRWWNLAALCQRCHLTIQGRVNMAQVFPTEHTDWFKPYAAGYYAATYLGEDLARNEVDERLDELLALEQVV